MNSIKSFFANVRQKFLDWHVNREIFNGIFPHLRHEQNHGYPFSSDEEFWRVANQAHLEAKALLHQVEQQAQSMPKAYAEGFRYTMYTDLNKRMRRYLQVGRRRVDRPCDPRFVATHA